MHRVQGYDTKCPQKYEKFKNNPNLRHLKAIMQPDLQQKVAERETLPIPLFFEEFVFACAYRHSATCKYK